MADPRAPRRRRRIDRPSAPPMRALAPARADAVVSAGSSGATVAAAALVARPAGPACAARRWPRSCPARPARLVLLDVGAGIDADQPTLVQHARPRRRVRRRSCTASPTPRVGLLSIGTEPGKGDRLRRAVAVALPRLAPARRRPLRRAGRGPRRRARRPRPTSSSPTASPATCCSRASRRRYALVGRRPPAPAPPRAAVLLGVAGTVVVCHGAATGADVASGIALAARLHRARGRSRRPIAEPAIELTRRGG